MYNYLTITFCLTLLLNTAVAMQTEQSNTVLPGWKKLCSVPYNAEDYCTLTQDGSVIIVHKQNQDNSIEFYNAQTGERTDVIHSEAQQLLEVTLSPGQKYLKGFGSNAQQSKNLYTLWSLATKQLLHQTETTNFTYELSPQDHYLITERNRKKKSGFVEIRDATSNRLISLINKPPQTRVAHHFIAFSPDESLAAIAFENTGDSLRQDDEHFRHNQFKIIHLKTGKVVAKLPGSSACTPGFSTDNKYVAMGSSSGLISLYSLNDFSLINRFDFHKQPIRNLYFSCDNNILMAQTYLHHKREIALIDFIHNNCLQRISDASTCLNKSKTGIIARGNPTIAHVVIYPLKDMNQPQMIKINPKKLSSTDVHFSPQGTYAVIARRENSIFINTQENNKNILPHRNVGLQWPYFSHDENTMVYKKDDSNLEVLKRIGKNLS